MFTFTFRPHSDWVAAITKTVSKTNQIAELMREVSLYSRCLHSLFADELHFAVPNHCIRILQEGNECASSVVSPLWAAGARLNLAYTINTNVLTGYRVSRAIIITRLPGAMLCSHAFELASERTKRYSAEWWWGGELLALPTDLAARISRAYARRMSVCVCVCVFVVHCQRRTHITVVS